ncbi:hypothetical protein B7P43_G03676 [Cryptotermes secundus]|uniref:Uncharacterized protein n=1 Tax=Cryptotermes secundus TaxID=105785 RepID=A0A2J7RNF5_9NEOP|nr:hypothetical protein B7P43_G03676 [Cryptotermes secundus]
MGTPQELKLSTAYKTVRRKFYQSIFKWFADDTVNEETKSASPPDVGDLVNILRSIGFKLRAFDKCEHRRDYSMSTSTSSLNSAEGLKIADCRVEITCGHSGLRAILESVEGECRCPPIESATQAEFWQVSGSAPVALGSQESIGSVQEAGSSLVPPLAPAVAAVVKDIMLRVLNITCDPEFGEIDTSRHSLTGNSYLNVSHHRSLDTLPLAHSTGQLYGSETEIAECAEQTKKLLPRTTSSVELSACSASPVSRSGSADLIKHHEPRDSNGTPQHSSSPMSILSASLERITLTEKHGIFCRLEFAKRSITEAMAMLQVQPLSVDTTLNKVIAQCLVIFFLGKLHRL